MTVEEAIKLANTGDISAMNLLGNYYFEQKDMGESIRWYSMAADLGDGKSMACAASALMLSARASFIVSGVDKMFFDELVQDICRAIKYAEAACKNGYPKDQDTANQAEILLGSVYSLAGLKHGRIDYSRNAVKLLGKHYSCDEERLDHEGLFYYAHALWDLNEKGDADTQARYTLINEVARKAVSYDTLSDSWRSVLYFYLGYMYTFALVCKEDLNKAHDYLTKATTLGLDCGELLEHFKKKMFGGYKLV